MNAAYGPLCSLSVRTVYFDISRSDDNFHCSLELGSVSKYERWDADRVLMTWTCKWALGQTNYDANSETCDGRTSVVMMHLSGRMGENPLTLQKAIENIVSRDSIRHSQFYIWIEKETFVIRFDFCTLRYLGSFC